MATFFDYTLPDRLIAQHPSPERDESRLLVVHRGSGELEHRTFRDLPMLLSAGDMVVLNDTRVLPARVFGRREKTGGKWEGLFLNDVNGLWQMMCQTRGCPQVGEAFALNPVGLRLILRGRTPQRHWLMEPDQPGSPEDLLAAYGHTPLPPYIRKSQSVPTDAERYQTVFAERLGSVAAPTAGLHFTPQVLAELQARQIATARVTLHVGQGTFAPVVGDPEAHTIHREWCEVTAATVEAIRTCKGRVVAVGTTSTRTLETAARTGVLTPYRGDSDLYIRDPFPFRVLGGLITNFHLPRTTLLLLVGAFTGSELLRRAYEEAIRREYRFYSYGDAMLIL